MGSVLQSTLKLANEHVARENLYQKHGPLAALESFRFLINSIKDAINSEKVRMPPPSPQFGQQISDH